MDYFALYPQQGVKETGNTISGIFDEFYRAQGNSRRNALLDFQLEDGEVRQGIATDQNNRANETHALQQEAGQFKLDQLQGAQLYRAFEALEGLPPEARTSQIELMKPGLRERGFDDNDWAILATDEGLAQGKQMLSQYAPAPVEAKVGRFRTFDTEDGATIRFDSATGETEVIRESETPDITILPEGLQSLVKDQPREIQQNAIKSYTNSDDFLRRMKQDEKQSDKDLETLTNSTLVIEQIDSALDQTSALTVGMGGLLAIVPGTSARDLQATLDTIKANIGFAELQAMRDNSPTGGALGNVTERELNRLESTIDSLDQLQSEESIRKALQNIKESYNLTRGIINGTITAPQSDDEYDLLEKGAIFIDPEDGRAYRK